MKEKVSKIGEQQFDGVLVAIKFAFLRVTGCPPRLPELSVNPLNEARVFVIVVRDVKPPRLSFLRRAHDELT